MHADPILVVPLPDWLDLHPHHQSPSNNISSVLAQAVMIVGTMVG